MCIRDRRRAQVDIMPSLYKCVVGVARFYAVLLLVWLRCVPFFSQAGSCPGVLRWVGMRCIDGLGRVVFGRVVFAPEAGRAYVFFCSTSRTNRGHTGGGNTAVQKKWGSRGGSKKRGEVGSFCLGPSVFRTLICTLTSLKRGEGGQMCKANMQRPKNVP